jgi:hypothetical protein
VFSGLYKEHCTDFTLQIPAQSSGVLASSFSKKLGFVAMYGLIIMLTIVFKVVHVQMDLLTLAAVLIVIFTFVVPVSTLFLKSALEMQQHASFPIKT